MAAVTRTGIVQSVTHTKTGSIHVYSGKVKYEIPNPSPPPPTIEVIVDHPLDEKFYEDLRAALGGDKPVKTTYDDVSNAVSGVTINP